LFIGPVFTREAAVVPRRKRHFVTRGVYTLSLLLLTFTAWLVLTGTQRILNIGDMARFGAALFQILAPLQLALMLFLAAIQSASNVAIEKDRDGVMLVASLPIFMLIVLFGGTSFTQVGWSFAVTAAAVLAAGSLGATLAFWREKTFQALALVALAIVFWIGLFEGLGLLPISILGFESSQLAAVASPFRAIVAASHPTVIETWPTDVVPFLITASLISVALCGLTILRVRCWNPSRDVRPGQASSADSSATGDVDMFTGKVIGIEDAAAADTSAAINPEAAAVRSLTGKQAVSQGEQFRSGHVDDRTRSTNKKSRRVWDNPILWREICTWAYGKKILFIRAAYWLLAAFVFAAIYSLTLSGFSIGQSVSGVSIPLIAKPIAPFLFVSLVMVNALAVTAITTERDGRALDLLMVTDLSPKEFLFGKLFGVMTIAADMIARFYCHQCLRDRFGNSLRDVVQLQPPSDWC